MAWSAMRTWNFPVFRQWQPAKPRSGMSITFDDFNFCTVCAIWFNVFGNFSLSFNQNEHANSFRKLFPIFSGDWAVFCTYDTFHFTIRKDHSEQVCARVCVGSAHVDDWFAWMFWLFLVSWNRCGVIETDAVLDGARNRSTRSVRVLI